MALELEQSYKGYTANYWRITRLSPNYERNETQVILTLYKDATTRKTDSDAVLLTQGKTYNEIIENRDDAYVKVKEPVLVAANPEDPEDDTTVNTNPFTKSGDV